jgi:hypothetical protein
MPYHTSSGVELMELLSKQLKSALLILYIPYWKISALEKHLFVATEHSSSKHEVKRNLGTTKVSSYL